MPPVAFHEQPCISMRLTGIDPRRMDFLRSTGTQLTCPHCGKDSAYQAFDLRYRAD
jgi:hypothetical protein